MLKCGLKCKQSAERSPNIWMENGELLVRSKLCKLESRMLRHKSSI